jgi:hypothetical protein
MRVYLRAVVCVQLSTGAALGARCGESAEARSVTDAPGLLAGGSSPSLSSTLDTWRSSRPPASRTWTVSLAPTLQLLTPCISLARSQYHSDLRSGFC